MNAYNLYKLYVSLKSHFCTDNYDFFMYNKKIKVSENAFVKRKDYNMFIMLSSMLPDKIATEFLVSQFVEPAEFNIRSLYDNPAKAQKIYNCWKERVENLFETYKKDISTIAVKSNFSWKNCLMQKDGDYPLLFKLVMSKEISPESYSLMNDLFSHINKTYRDISSDTIFIHMNRKYKKYRSFLSPTVSDLVKVTPRMLTEIKR